MAHLSQGRGRSTRQAGLLDNFIKMFNVLQNHLGKTSAALVLTLAAACILKTYDM